MKYKNKDGIVDAVQWFREGDHPEVVKILITPEGVVAEDSIIYAAWEYAIGSLVTLTYGIADGETMTLVTPGDYIITNNQGETSVCKPDIFESTCKPVARY